jgi:predicted N-formylglutamate amidohydrolase
MKQSSSVQSAAFTVLNPQGRGAMVLICDHASNLVPAELNDLGLPQAELRRHIAWDIGAAGITELLAARFDVPAVTCGTSRLVIDCNRHPTDRSAMPLVSDGTQVPGNLNLSESDRARRVAAYFTPYHDEIERVIQRKQADQPDLVFISIHSMTEAMAGIERPWQISFSWRDDARLSQPMIEVLRQRGDIVVGDNQPYDLDPAEDYSVPQHAIRRGLRHLQVEFRQDLVADSQGVADWAGKFGDALAVVLGLNA